jgi:hypothetical protein
MKNSINILFVLTIALFTFNSCEKDAGKLPTIAFKTGSTYISTDVTKPTGSTILIGIDAAKAEDRDYLKKIDISKSINGAASVSVFNKDLAKSERDNYSYDFSTTLDATAGQTCKYTFTITNRDGLTNQIFSTVTAQ